MEESDVTTVLVRTAKKVMNFARNPYKLVDMIWDELSALDAAVVALGEGEVIFPITPTAGNDLELQAVSGKDIVMHLTDAAGARSIKLKDSGGNTVLSIDSDGNIVGTLFTGAIAASSGTFAGSHTGDIVNNNVAAHDYGGVHADWTLASTEKKALVLNVSNADQAVNIIAPAENRMYIVHNNAGFAVTIKKAAGTGVAIANGRAAIVYYDGSDYARATADASY